MKFHKPKCPKCLSKIGIRNLIRFGRAGYGNCPNCKIELLAGRSGWGYSILCFIPGVFVIMMYRDNALWAAVGVLGFITASFIYYVNMKIQIRKNEP